MDFVFFGLSILLIELDLLGLTEMDLVFLGLSLSLIELDLLGFTEVGFDFLGLALFSVAVDSLRLTEVDFLGVRRTLCVPELDLLGVTAADFLVALNVVELIKDGSATVFLVPIPASQAPDLLRLTGVNLIFLGIVSTAPESFGQMGKGSLVPSLLFGFPFSMTHLLGDTVQVFVAVHGSELVLVLLVCRQVLR